MINFFTIIDATTHNDNFGTIVKKRPVCAAPFMGKYKLIDFTLSSITNSGCERVLVFTSHSSGILQNHVKGGINWRLDRNHSGLYFIPSNLDISYEPFINYKRFLENLDFITRTTKEYVVITHGHGVFEFQIGDKVQEHIASEADISVLHKNDQSMKMFILKKDLLVELTKAAKKTGNSNIIETIAANAYSNEYKVNKINVNEPYYEVQDLQSFFELNFMFLSDEAKYAEIFRSTNKIFTKEKNWPPFYIGYNGAIKNSVVENGSEVDGNIENSIIWSNVKIAKDANIKNSLVFNSACIGENAVLEYCIVDKEAYIGDGVKIIGTKEAPRYIFKGQHVEK